MNVGEYRAAIETAVAAIGSSYERLNVPASLFFDGNAPPEHVLWALAELCGRLLRAQPDGLAGPLLRTWAALACEMHEPPEERFEVPDVWPPPGDGITGNGR